MVSFVVALLDLFQFVNSRQKDFPSFCTCAVMSVLIRYLVTDIFHSCRLCHFDMDFDAVLRALTNLAENSIELVYVVVVVPH